MSDTGSVAVAQQNDVVQPKVLLVEDDAHIQHLIRLVLTRAGYDVVPASGTQAAQRLMAEQTFTAAVLDLCLPDGRGDQLATLLRRNAPDTRIVMTSAVAHTSLVLQDAAESGDVFLLKPFSNAALLAAVANTPDPAVQPSPRF